MSVPTDNESILFSETWQEYGYSSLLPDAEAPEAVRRPSAQQPRDAQPRGMQPRPAEARPTQARQAPPVAAPPRQGQPHPLPPRPVARPVAPAGWQAPTATLVHAAPPQSPPLPVPPLQPVQQSSQQGLEAPAYAPDAPASKPAMPTGGLLTAWLIGGVIALILAAANPITAFLVGLSGTTLLRQKNAQPRTRILGIVLVALAAFGLFVQFSN